MKFVACLIDAPQHTNINLAHWLGIKPNRLVKAQIISGEKILVFLIEAYGCDWNKNCKKREAKMQLGLLWTNI